MGKKKFVEKVYFKVVYDGTNVLNGNGNLLVTFPQTQSFILTTKETGSKFLKEKPDTVVTDIVYRTPENPSTIGSPIIINLQTNIKEKDSFVSIIGTDVFPGGSQNPPKIELDSVVTGASGRFKGATKAKYIIRTTAIEGNIITRTFDVTISGHR
jgi:hypothetical protein